MCLVHGKSSVNISYYYHNVDYHNPQTTREVGAIISIL